MTMAIDNQQRFGLNFGHMPYTSSPQFTNPWTSATSAPAQSHSLYAPSHNAQHAANIDHVKQQQQQQQQQQQHQHHQALPSRTHPSVSMGSYGNVPITAGPAGSSLGADAYGSQDLLTMTQDMLSPNRSMSSVSSAYGTDSSYSGAPSPVHSAYAPSQAPYDNMGYAPAPVRSTYAIQSQDNSRRLSQPSVPSNSFLDVQGDEERQHRQNSLVDFHNRGMRPENRTFGDAIDASRGMIAMSQDQTTPRNIYGAQGRVGRGSGDSYGFPSTHSSSSSISSSQYPGYYGGSVDSSASDYSGAGSDMESVSSRTLPRPSGLLTGSLPPAPSTMMTQFSSKASSSAQKKHKCKVCDKRFTRPSSLQTHMYSHTGEKPFSCEVEGCGRHFSVVSNLRRHRKVHKGEARSEAGSEDHHSDD